METLCCTNTYNGERENRGVEKDASIFICDQRKIWVGVAQEYSSLCSDCWFP